MDGSLFIKSSRIFFYQLDEKSKNKDISSSDLPQCLINNSLKNFSANFTENDSIIVSQL